MAERPVVQTAGAAAPDWTEETDLALARFGGSIVFATDGTRRDSIDLSWVEWNDVLSD